MDDVGAWQEHVSSSTIRESQTYQTTMTSITIHNLKYSCSQKPAKKNSWTENTMGGNGSSAELGTCARRVNHWVPSVTVDDIEGSGIHYPTHESNCHHKKHNLSLTTLWWTSTSVYEYGIYFKDLFKVNPPSSTRYLQLTTSTPLRTNMSPENQWLEDVFPTEIVPFRGHVSFLGCNKTWTTSNVPPAPNPSAAMLPTRWAPFFFGTGSRPGCTTWMVTRPEPKVMEVWFRWFSGFQLGDF